MRSNARFTVKLACLIAITVAATGAILSSTYSDARTGLLFCLLGVAAIAVDLAVGRTVSR